MDQIDEAKRKPRRTKGTPSYQIRNRFAVAGILAGSAVFALWYNIPIFRKVNDRVLEYLTTETQEEKDRKFLFNLTGAPRTSKAIQNTLDETKNLVSER